MFKKYLNKQTVSAFISGGLLMTTITGIAATGYVVNENKFPILVNGVKMNIDALNINGSTYLKLSDFGKVNNARIVFNSKTKSIEIGEPKNQPVSTPDGIKPIDRYNDGQYYIGIAPINKHIQPKGYVINYLLSEHKYQLFKDKELIIEDIPTKNEVGYDAIGYDYYVKNIMPLVSGEK